MCKCLCAGGCAREGGGSEKETVWKSEREKSDLRGKRQKVRDKDSDKEAINGVVLSRTMHIKALSASTFSMAIQI